MPLNFNKDRESGFEVLPLRLWSKDGHQVALVRCTDLQPERNVAPHTYMVCECDYHLEDVVEDGKVVAYRRLSDPHSCQAKRAVQAELMKEHAVAWRQMLAEKGLSETILQLFAHVEADGYIGQAMAGVIYAQEVAEVLAVPLPQVMAALRTLFIEEKLDLNGMILAPFVKRFRFPKEMQYMIRMMVESPLGWPNGDAGGGAIYAMEEAIGEHTDFKHGKDAFWEHNYPNITPSHLLEFGQYFLAVALARAEEEPKACHDLRFTDCEALAKWLEKLAAKYRAFGAKNGFPKDVMTEIREREAAEKKKKKPRRPKKKPKKD